jgi:hypothetical protein
MVLLAALLVVTPQIALAQYSYFNWNSIDIVKIIFGPDIDSSWYQPYTALQYLVFPFIMIWMIIFGFLAEIRIFRNQPKVEVVLALVMALIASSTGWEVVMVRFLAQIMGAWSVLAFAALFCVGIFMYVGARFSQWGIGREQFADARQAFELERNIGNNQQQIRNLQNMPQNNDTINAIQFLINQNQQMQQQLNNVQRNAGRRARRGNRRNTRPGNVVIANLQNR